MHVRIFNYNTLERVHQFEAHSDYLRSIIVHPTQSFILTSSDDMLVKLWDWENKWSVKQTFEGSSFLSYVYFFQFIFSFYYAFSFFVHLFFFV